MSEFEILREIEADRGRYLIRLRESEAELTYKILSPETVVANHTGVPDAMRGTGAGKALVERMVADAEAEGFRIVPACSFVDAMRRRHPQWAQAFAA